MSTNVTSDHRAWLNDYARRREHLFRREVMRVSEDAFQAGRAAVADPLALPAFAREARARRRELSHKFCFVLWARAFNRQLFEKDAAGQQLDRSTEDAEGLLTTKARNFLPRMAMLTRRLDEAGFYALMLFPENVDGAPPEPLVLPASAAPIERENPESMPQWLFLFTGFAELAEAIIVEGNYGPGLKRELERLGDAGLLDRILLFDNNTELYRAGSRERWPLERIGDAVRHAAAL